MSGPIVRRYGFPNFDKIFGPKPVQHGVDDDAKGEGKEARGKEPSRNEAERAEGTSAEEAGPDR